MLPGAPSHEQSEYERLGVTPTPDEGRVGVDLPWDESSRPHRPPSGPEVSYTDQGRQAGQHLIDVHDMLRKELVEPLARLGFHDGQV